MIEYNMQMNGEPFKANRKNTTLFTFFGELAIYDHVFLVIEEQENGDYRGCYVFNVAQEQLYKNLAEFILNNNLPQVLNRENVAQCDVEAWDRRMLGDLTDTPPWNDLDQQQ